MADKKKKWHLFIIEYDGNKPEFYVDGKILSSETWDYVLTEEEMTIKFKMGSGIELENSTNN